MAKFRVLFFLEETDTDWPQSLRSLLNECLEPDFTFVGIRQRSKWRNDCPPAFSRQGEFVELAVPGSFSRTAALFSACESAPEPYIATVGTGSPTVQWLAWLQALANQYPSVDLFVGVTAPLCEPSLSAVQQLSAIFGRHDNAVLRERRLLFFSYACLALKREVLEQCGGFHSGAAVTCEDERLSQRLLFGGASYRFEPRWLVKCSSPSTLAQTARLAFSQGFRAARRVAQNQFEPLGAAYRRRGTALRPASSAALLRTWGHPAIRQWPLPMRVFLFIVLVADAIAWEAGWMCGHRQTAAAQFSGH